MRILSIDPSAAQRVGWAIYDTEEKEWDWGHIDIEGLNFKVRCRNLADSLAALQLNFEQIVFEWPTYYHGERGQIAAQQNFTVNLAGIVMFIAGWFQMEPKDYFHYTAPQWKGTVPKQVTARKFLKLFGEDHKSTDHN